MVAELVIRAVADMRGAKDEVKGLGDAVGSLAAPAAVAAGALSVMAYDIIGSASESEQAAGALAAVFGDATAAMTTNAEGAAASVGLAESEYSQLAAVMAAQLGNMGIAQDQVAGTTDGLISKGADLAAQFGGSTSDAVAALSSLMRGERDPIEKYGVSITAAAVEAQKAEMGLAGLTGEADKAATTQATLALLTEQTASAQGAFARETGTAAGAAQIAGATWENTKATLGEKLLPAVTAVTQGLTSMATFVSENSAVVLILGGIVGALAGAILLANAGMAAYKYSVAAITVAQWLWNAAMSANPLGLIVIAVVAVIAGIVLLVQNWETVKNVALAVWAAISDAVGKAATWLSSQFSGAITAVGGFFTGLGTKTAAVATGIADRAKSAASSVSAGWKSSVTAVGGFFTDMGTKTAAVATGIASGAVKAAVSLWTAWQGGVQKVIGFFNGLADSAQQVVNRIIGWFSAIPGKIMGFFNRIRIPDWIGNALGFLGLSAPAAELTMSYAPGLAMFTPWAPWSSPTRGISSSGSGSNAPAVSIEINVSGALDPQAVARQIRDLLNSDARMRGAVSLGGGALA